MITTPDDRRRIAAINDTLTARKKAPIAETRWLLETLQGRTNAHAAALRDAAAWRERAAELTTELHALIAALGALGIGVRGRDGDDGIAWAYTWQGGPEQGHFPDAATAFAAGLTERLAERDRP